MALGVGDKVVVEKSDCGYVIRKSIDDAVTLDGHTPSEFLLKTGGTMSGQIDHTDLYFILGFQTGIDSGAGGVNAELMFHDMQYPAGKSLSDIVANLNVFSSDPSTSRGAGEVIYQSTAGVLKVNTQSTNPTTNPTWTTVEAGGSGDFMADGSVPMTDDIDIGNNEIDNCNKINLEAGFTPAGYIKPTFSDPTSELDIWGLSEIRFFAGSLGSEVESMSITTEHINAQTNPIINVVDPSNAQDAATKKYVDDNAGGVTDHGDLTGLADDDHTQYLLANGSRSLTGDLTFNKLAPSIIFDTNDLLEYDKTSNAFDFSIGGSSKLYLSATDLIAKTNISFLKTDPVLQFDSYDYFKYINASNALQLFIASTIEYEFTASALDLKSNSLNNAAIPGTNNTSFIIDQDNAGAGVSSSLRFNRGSTDGDAAIWWDESDDEFQFESDVGVTVAPIKVSEVRMEGSNKIARNSGTGDMEFTVAAGDSFVFKTV